MHPLDHAYFRLDWAKKRLTELKAIYEAYIKEEAKALSKSIRIHLDMNSSIPDLHFPSKPHHLVPVNFPILVGEVAHHLRTSLDYLVYRLAILDSGSVQYHTQFPLEKYPKRFRANKPHPFLKGISATHTASIERLQPYNGVKWTEYLADISNRDKHNDLIVAISRSAFRMRAGTGPNFPAEPSECGLFISCSITEKNTVIREAYKVAADSAMYMQFHIALFITFDNGLRVVDTLQEIETEVRNTLADFKSEF